MCVQANTQGSDIEKLKQAGIALKMDADQVGLQSLPLVGLEGMEGGDGGDLLRLRGEGGESMVHVTWTAMRDAAEVFAQRHWQHVSDPAVELHEPRLAVLQTCGCVLL